MAPKNRKFWSQKLMFSMTPKTRTRHSEHLGVFFRPCRGPLATRSRHIHMTRRAVSCRVIPNTGFSSQDGSTKVLVRWGCSTLNFLKSVNSFCTPVFFYRFLASRFSIGGVKSQNEFVTKALTCNKYRFHDTEISKIFGAKIDVLHDTETATFWPER